MLFIACESSCDDTDIALFDSDKNKVIASESFSQISLHASFGGVIPDKASESHLSIIDHLYLSLLKKVELTNEMIDCFAATVTPGLSSALLIGSNFMKAIAWDLKKPFIGVNHLLGHVYSVCIDQEVQFPYLCLSASGGHTSLYYVKNFYELFLLGKTADDAVGEAFDKIAHFIGLPYPGGPSIERLAREWQGNDEYQFPRLKNNDCNFSFSGLKTAVIYAMVERKRYELKKKSWLIPLSHEEKISIAYSFLEAVSDILVKKMLSGLYEAERMSLPKVRSIAFVGGVARNERIKFSLREVAHHHGLYFFSSSSNYCMDNAAMIAFYASKMYEHDAKNIIDAGYSVPISPN